MRHLEETQDNSKKQRGAGDLPDRQALDLRWNAVILKAGSGGIGDCRRLTYDTFSLDPSTQIADCSQKS
jgi:hypothetical protein